jgi:competence protein ComEC
MRSRLWVVFVFLFAGVLSAAPPEQPSRVGEVRGDALLRVDFIDVGQGDAILLRSPNGKVVLIDAGAYRQVEALTTFLKEARITRIDALILTHAHADHIGGARTLIETLDVGLVYDAGYPHTTATYRKLLAGIRARKIRYKKAQDGMRIIMAPEIVLTILSPPGAWIEGERSPANTNTVVVRASYKDVDLLFTGDTEAETEARLVKVHGEGLASEVLKVGHHASHHASLAPFLKAVRPELGIIFCGANNRYGHPHEDTLDRLAEHGIRVYSTHVHGTITLLTDGAKIKLSTEKPAPPLR